MLGDFTPGKTVICRFNTHQANGTPITLAGTPAVSVYKNSTTESTAGVTLTVDYDSRTGLHHVAVDTSVDGTFYAGGNDFDLIITAGTVDSISVVGTKVGSFSLSNRSALRPTDADRTLDVTTTGEAGLDWSNIGNVNATVSFGATTLSSVTNVGTVSGLASGVITANSIATDAFTAAKFAASSLNGKGDWNIGKTGYSLTQTFPTNFSALSIDGSGRLDISKISGQTLSASGTITFPSATLASTTNITSASGISLAGTQTFNNTGTWTGNINGTLSTLTTYTGNTPQTGDSFARIGATGSGLTSLASASTLSSVSSTTSNIYGIVNHTVYGNAAIEDILSSGLVYSLGTVQTSVYPGEVDDTDVGSTLDFNGLSTTVKAYQVIGAVSGTGPTFDGKVQESTDGTTWTDVIGATFTTVTSSNNNQEITFTRTKRYLRHARTVAGTSPTFVINCTFVPLNVTTLASINSSLGSILTDTGTDIPAQISALNNLSTAQVNAEVDQALADVGLTTTVTGRIDAAVSSRLASGSYTAPDNTGITNIYNIVNNGTYGNSAIRTSISNLPTANVIADTVGRRTSANMEDSATGDALASDSIYGLLRYISHSEASGSVLTIYKDDGTSLDTKTLTTDDTADPITGIE